MQSAEDTESKIRVIKTIKQHIDKCTKTNNEKKEQSISSAELKEKME